jgi:hypothetical protein
MGKLLVYFMAVAIIAVSSSNNYNQTMDFFDQIEKGGMFGQGMFWDRPDVYRKYGGDHHEASLFLFSFLL